MGRNVQPPRDAISYIKNLEKRIENLERSQRIGNTSVDNGNVVVNNGAIVSKHPNGVELFRAGRGETTLPFAVDPTQGYLTRVKRANGNTVFEAFSSEAGGESRFVLQDRNGNPVLSEDWLVGNGMGRPYIPIRTYKLSEWSSPPDLVTAASFTGVYLLEFNMQHPSVYVNIRTIADAGTAGEIRLQDTFFTHTMWSDTISTAFNGNKEGTGNIHILRSWGQNMSLEVQARRTAGTGNLRFQLAMAYGTSAQDV